MNTESILSTLLAAAAFLKHAVQDVAGQAIKDAYDVVKAHLKKRFGESSSAAHALDLATDKPESLLRKTLLAEESAPFQIERDAELALLVECLAALLPPALTTPPSVRVEGSGNRVQVAGRDLIQTTKFVRRNTITPDERHITVEQRERLRRVLAELAERLVGPNGRGGVAAVHAMLQRRFNIASYLLLPREQFGEAMDYLRQQRAAHRSRLRAANPVAYQNDLYRAVFAGARELGWSGETVYRFAGEKLGLKNPITSLKELGPVQLKSLADCIRREVRTHRDGMKAGGVSAA